MHPRMYFVRHRRHQLSETEHHTHPHAHQGHPHQHPHQHGDPRLDPHRGHPRPEGFAPEGRQCSPFGEDGPRGRFFSGRGGPGRRGHGPRVKPGNVRAAILALLSESPFNGYQIIQEIAQRSDNVWKPSSGSVYPALQQLIDEGLIQETVAEGKRAFELTQTGQAYCQEHPEEVSAPWKLVTDGVSDSMFEFRASLGQMMNAAMQVAQVGSPEQVTEANKLLVKTRKALYKLLAEEDSE